jgi:tRNA dimethylallyltransferase
MLDSCDALHLSSSIEWLNARLAMRFDLMIKEGALDEAQANLKTWNPGSQSSQAIGAPELIAHLRGHCSLEEAKKMAVTASRQYAKRQRTWFRKHMVHWHSLETHNL